MVVRQVNTNVDKFVADNADIRDLDFKDVSWDMRNILSSIEIVSL
jgi:hypothetical protein